MNLTEGRLRRELEQRVRALRPDLLPRLAAGPADEAWTKLLTLEPSPDADLTAVVVLDSFDLASWIRETCVFAAGTPPETAADWRRSFTRTLFLAGQPANLRERFTFEHIAPDGHVAWSGPAHNHDSGSLRRLLRLFEAGATVAVGAPFEVTIPDLASSQVARPASRAARRELYVATADLTITRCLIALNHLLVESIFDGLIAGGTRLRVRRIPRLVGLPGEPLALRIGADHGNPTHLRALACLTEEIIDG